MAKASTVNVVATASLNQSVDLCELGKLSEVLYGPDTYGGMAAYFKSPTMKGKISIFRSGKMISVGTRSEKEAINELECAKECLIQKGLAKSTTLKPEIQNIVAVADFERTVNLEDIAEEVRAIYEPEQFPGLIYRMKDPSVVVLLFSTGKAVCTGARNEADVYRAVREISQILEKRDLMGHS